MSTKTSLRPPRPNCDGKAEDINAWRERAIWESQYSKGKQTAHLCACRRTDGVLGYLVTLGSMPGLSERMGRLTVEKLETYERGILTFDRSTQSANLLVTSDYEMDCGEFAVGFDRAEAEAIKINGYHLSKGYRHIACNRASALKLLDDDEMVIISHPETPGRGA